jgi:hypothetical protein
MDKFRKNRSSSKDSPNQSISPLIEVSDTERERSETEQFSVVLEEDELE